jgi:hypothetical protein
LDESGFLNALYECDAFVITEKPGSGASFIPSKLIPAISSGTPILAICDRSGPLGREVVDSTLGTIVGWEDNLESALPNFFEDKAQFERFQKNCLTRAQTYGREFAICRIGGLLNKMLTQ